MNVLVLGGTGFLGRYLVEQLIQDQCLVTVLTRSPEKLKIFSKEISFIKGDLLNPKDLSFSGYTHVINCSGELHNEGLMQDLHVNCIEELLTKLKSCGMIHWIQISSVGVYGKIRQGEVDENTPFAPIGEYEVTKAKGELLVKNLCTKQGTPYTIIRPSNVFGIGMPNQSLAQLVSMIKRKLFFYIGKNPESIVMNYVPVEDVAAFVSLCVRDRRSINQEVILSDQLSLSDFVKIICEELKIQNDFYRLPEAFVRVFALLANVLPRFPLTTARIDALTMRVTYSHKKAVDSLSYAPFVGCSQGLKDYISYYKDLG